ncbi:hypothetical protein C823_005342 [Eubacterium plexicaudatum ASF492]|uniref:Helicase ATP-binding domain-containing protein n=1 Tax=Eubacterium plexicaudatum ASF492 TaxID=1235802 RepID=N2B5U8_9FIRM|nr:hypothetical protein C823_005342 [Eubacterium plexicaudatum ASF492]
MNDPLHHWQEICLKRWFANNSRGIVQAVTGSGKTLLALTAAYRLEQMLAKPLRVKIIVPTGSLMWQWNHSLREFLSHQKTTNKKIGLRGDGCKSSLDCSYMIYVINSARYELARQILEELKNGEFVLLIADECHHYASGQNQLIFEFIPHIKPYEAQFFSLGLTATLPSEPAMQTLTASLGRKIYTYGMTQASAYNTICQYNIFHIELSFRKAEKAEYDDVSDQLLALYRRLVQLYPFLADMNSGERYEMLRRLSTDKSCASAGLASKYMRLTYIRTNLICLASARIDCAVTLITQLSKRTRHLEKILIFGERISQADQLFLLLENQFPGRIGRYHSQMGQQANKNTLERFRTGDIRILITCKSIDEGIDVPDASVGIILSGTSTKRQRVQRLGRIIRKAEGKTGALLYYLHLADTSEETFFLPDTGKSKSFDLTFLSDSRQFIHPAYDKAANKLLRRMWHAGIKKDQLREAKRCLKAGCIRSDWLMEQTELDTQVQNAKYTGDKNYWKCMRKLHELIPNTSDSIE